MNGLNVTQAERRALKEHINILDCVQRERERSEAEQCVRKCAYCVCMWRRDVSVGGMSMCMCANVDGLVPVTLLSLIFSRWETDFMEYTGTHTHVLTQTRRARLI